MKKNSNGTNVLDEVLVFERLSLVRQTVFKCTNIMKTVGNMTEFGQQGSAL